MSGAVCIRAIISGRVQGVSYRAWTVGNARQHGLTGWVRNRRDGTVEALFCGPAEAVDAMLTECRKGPLAARVTNIAREPWSGDMPADFRKLETV